MNNVDQPKVSIVLSCYGVEKYLDRCVESMIHQSLKDIEIILVDDVSPDRVPEMCDNWAKKDKRIRVVHKEKNGGLGYARNSGLAVATGKYVAFIDSDDYVSLTMMEKLYNVAEKYGSQAAYCGFYTVNDLGNVVSKRIEVDEETHYQGSKMCMDIGLEMIGSPTKRENCRYSMSVWHAIYQRQFLVDENIKFCSERDFISEDMIFDVDFFGKADNVVFIPEAHYYYCYNGASLSRKFNPSRYERTVVHHRELLRRLSLNNYPTISVECAHKYLVWASRNIVNNILESKISFSEKRNSVYKICRDVKTWQVVQASNVKSLLSKLPMLYYYCFVKGLPICVMLLSYSAILKNKIKN